MIARVKAWRKTMKDKKTKKTHHKPEGSALDQPLPTVALPPIDTSIPDGNYTLSGRFPDPSKEIWGKMQQDALDAWGGDRGVVGPAEPLYPTAGGNGGHFVGTGGGPGIRANPYVPPSGDARAPSLFIKPEADGTYIIPIAEVDNIRFSSEKKPKNFFYVPHSLTRNGTLRGVNVNPRRPIEVLLECDGFGGSLIHTSIPVDEFKKVAVQLQKLEDEYKRSVAKRNALLRPTYFWCGAEADKA